MGCVGVEEQIKCGTIRDMLISDVCPGEIARGFFLNIRLV